MQKIQRGQMCRFPGAVEGPRGFMKLSSHFPDSAISELSFKKQTKAKRAILGGGVGRLALEAPELWCFCGGTAQICLLWFILTEPFSPIWVNQKSQVFFLMGGESKATHKVNIKLDLWGHTDILIWKIKIQLEEACF